MSKKSENTLLRSSIWTNVYGLSRTLLAFGTLATLLFNDTDILFKPTGMTVSTFSPDNTLISYSLFAIVPENNLELARWFAIAILFIVITGWRPRITGIIHWWIAFSFAANCILIDGGDQVNAVLTLLLVPITLTDNRSNHWHSQQDLSNNLKNKIFFVIGSSTYTVIRLQVSIIYFWASVAKFSVTEWANGTALYYWFSHPIFGLPDWLKPIFMPLLQNEVSVSFLTWGVLLFETVLFMGLVMNKRFWPILLWLGIFFHFGIMIIHGLVSFFFAMAAALILYLHPADRQFIFFGNIKNGLIAMMQNPIMTRISASRK